MTRAFEEAARDPRIIAGVHRCCDEWCDMCPVTSRCLAFRCMAIYRKEKNRRHGEPTFRHPGDTVEFTRRLSAAERLGPELDAGAGAAAAALRTADPLAGTAWQYALAVSLWLVFTPDDLRNMRAGTTPSPEEVVLWYHFRIYTKLVRVLVAADVRPGRRTPGDTVAGLAKLTLVSVQRSRKALHLIRSAGAPDATAPLLAMLDTLEQGVEARFPGARQYVRIGLDPACPGPGSRRPSI